MTTTIGKKGAGSPERVDAEGDVEPLPRDGDEVEIEVVRRGPQPDPGVGYPRGDSEGDLQMRVQLRAVDVVRGDPGMSKQLVEQDASPGPHLTPGHAKLDQIRGCGDGMWVPRGQQ